MPNPKKPPEFPPQFSLDEKTNSEMSIPSVTRLLNRKSLSEPNLPSKKSISTPPLPPSLPPPLPPSLPPSKIEQLQPSEPLPAVPEIPKDSPPEITIGSADESEIVLELQGQQKVSHESSISNPETPSFNLTPEISSSELDFSKTESSETQTSPENFISSSSPPKIQAAQRRVRNIQNLILWDFEKLATGADPLGKGIAFALQKKAIGALFLAILPQEPEAPAPKFVSTAAVLGESKLRIWTGLNWDPTVVPEMWNQFVKAGYVDLPPPGSFTQANSHRNIIRGAFGILQTEWLLLVRAGSATQCRGIVAFVTSESIVPKITEILSLIASPLNP